MLSDASAKLVIAVTSDAEPELAREVVVEPGASIVVGRDPDAELFLDDARVSRRHLRIRARRGSALVEDLGSTNGSFLNGRPVTRDVLRVGDRLVVGTTVLEVREVRAPMMAPAHEDHDPARSTMHDAAPWLSGQLEEIPTFVILQVLASMRKSGLLVVRGDAVAQLWLRDGDVIHATIPRIPAQNSQKSLFRALSWKNGSFELLPDERTPSPTLRDVHTQQLLLEGHRQLDELERLASKLPRPDARVVLRTDALDAARPIEAELVALARARPTWSELLDHSAATDLDVAEALLALLIRGVLAIEA
ncbi:DUF4388 domain-containing protein [Myxococcota bacterium]|nr:DUF4388 domain-containing protein [Myxococcota bacterium]